MDFQKRYAGLNTAQRAAVDTIEGPVMVIAGPGTGKTELLSVRTANILQKTDTLAENILCLTFTESGAAAMRERLVGIIGKDAYKVAIHTFHSFGTEIISQNREYFYKGAVFEPANDLKRYEILRGIFEKLDYRNPLASTMNGEYTHQFDTMSIISELKRSGLTSDELLAVLDANEKTIDIVEKLVTPIFASTVSAKTGVALEAVLPELETLANSEDSFFEVPPLSKAIYTSLTHALDLAKSEHPTKPITAWKNKWLVRDDQKRLVCKSRAYIIKLRAVAFVYYEYLNELEKLGLYDYDDMILQVVHAIEVHDELRLNLQEKYLYIMVDEFQDTNLAQMRILHNLTDSPVHEGKPNILVVGDDDQAIYSFQGADISNIFRFQDIYKETKLISLIENYRSGAPIIEQARRVIAQGNNRLETITENLSKVLHTQHTEANFQIHSATTIEGERHWVVESIKAALAEGTAAQDIAVLARRHNEIQALLPYFQAAGIDVHYERQDSVIDQPPIIALELVAKIVLAMSKGDYGTANSLLPQMLAHAAFKVSPKELWEISLKAYKTKQQWLELLETSPKLTSIHTWLITLSSLVPHTAMEPMIDYVLGRTGPNDMTSPLFEYFFSEDVLTNDPSSYLDYLHALRTIRTQLRDYRRDEPLTLGSFIEFIEIHRRLNIPLTVSYNSPTETNAVHLMTAHKSKGLEFDTVYILNGVDSVWGEKARTANRTIHYPENLTLAPTGEVDERLRLFYVAMTRAKRELHISYSEQNDSQKATLIASFLADNETPVEPIPALAESALITANELAWYAPIVRPSSELANILQPILDSYKLSATHLNAFIDITNGGPQHFLLDHLLHFPSTKSASASYGSAVHRTLQQAHVHLSAHKEQRPLEDILHDFEQNLTNEHLDKKDHDFYLQKGSEQLQAFLDASYDHFNQSQKSELSFSHQEVVIENAHLTGMIDVVDIHKSDQTVVVTDYKTGKAATSWTGSSDYEKIKLHKYRQQLMFYKLLIEHSRDYSQFSAHIGRLAFVEPTRSGDIIRLEMIFDSEELARFKLLLLSVWKHIKELNIPDISSYEASYRGILAFEQDLIDGKI